MSLQTLLRELGVREAEFEPQFTGPNRTVFTEELEKRWIQQGPGDWFGALVSLLRSLVGQDVYEVGKGLAEIRDLIQLVKQENNLEVLVNGNAEEGACLDHLKTNVARFVSTWSS